MGVDGNEGIADDRIHIGDSGYKKEELNCFYIFQQPSQSNLNYFTLFYI